MRRHPRPRVEPDQGQRPLLDALEPIYRKASQHAVVFLLGATVGSLTVMGLGKKVVAQKLQATPAQNASRWVDKLDQQLHLTPAQKEQFLPVLEESLDDIQIVRRRSFAATRQILENAESQLLPGLTEEQKKSYERLKTERREKFSKMLGNREVPTLEEK